ncbi:MAG: M15 family metallopeptidase [Polyangiaceae bacterium]|nr:M15 family metallopeptidase [Polyangiaceae bacterium]
MTALARRVAAGLAGVAVGAVLVAELPTVAVASEGRAEAAPKERRAGSKARSCKPQRAKRFLERTSFVKGGALDAEAHGQALRWRVERYGHVPGAPYEDLNERSAASFAKPVRFLGLPIVVHEKMAPALACVETRIRATCKGKGKAYVPKAIGGLRAANTYRGGEVSNHLFGLAIDIDPPRNPCCGCVAPWRDHALCKKPRTKSVWDRTALTPCWVAAFERHGFHWLAKDPLEDTMHFEYLGEPR